jgi:hypothetical protein
MAKVLLALLRPAGIAVVSGGAATLAGRARPAAARPEPGDARAPVRM